MAYPSSIFRNITSFKMMLYEKPHMDMLWHSMDLKTVPRKDRMWQLHDPWRCFTGHLRDNLLLLPHRCRITAGGNRTGCMRNWGPVKSRRVKGKKKSKEKTCAVHPPLFFSRECRGRNVCTLTFPCLVFPRFYLAAREAKRTSMSLHQKVHFSTQEMQILQSIPSDCKSCARNSTGHFKCRILCAQI